VVGYWKIFYASKSCVEFCAKQDKIFFNIKRHQKFKCNFYRLVIFTQKEKIPINFRLRKTAISELPIQFLEKSAKCQT
jgi:hypothetical protein